MPERAVERPVAREARHDERATIAIRIGAAQQDPAIGLNCERVGDPSDRDPRETAVICAERTVEPIRLPSSA